VPKQQGCWNPNEGINVRNGALKRQRTISARRVFAVHRGLMRRSVSPLTARMGMTTLVEAASAAGAPQGKPAP